MSEYFQLDRTKRLINARSDISDDLVTELGASASIEMRNFLLSITEDIPKGDHITDDIYNAVSYEVAGRFWLIQKNYDAAKMWKEDAKDARESIRVGIQKLAENDIEIIHSFGRGDT